MRPTRLLSTTIVVGVAALATFFACGGDDGGGGGGGNVDAFVQLDAKVFMDAPPASLGSTCTPSMDGSGQGTCPTGYTCLRLGSASPAWCSKSCVRGSGDQCDTGYTGPGVANCMWDVSFTMGGSAYQYCGVICSGTSACGSAAGCDGTCPGSMTCTQPIGTGSGAGSACK
jgi:hypothetical protein